MTAPTHTPQPRQRATDGRPWCALPTEDVAAALGVDPADGLSAGRAAEPLRTNGPNALPEERAVPGRRRCLAGPHGPERGRRGAAGGQGGERQGQFGWALVPAVALLAPWELGKALVRKDTK